MPQRLTAESATLPPYRLWPGVAAALLQWVFSLGAPAIDPEWTIVGLLGVVAFGAVVFAWWVAFSRASWVERLGTLVLIAVAFAAITLVVHPSVSNGMMGMMPAFYAIPFMSLAVVIAPVIGSRRLSNTRWMAKGVAIALACAALAAIRTDGIRGAGGSDVRWRWSESAEERLLASGPDTIATIATASQPLGTPSIDARSDAPLIEDPDPKDVPSTNKTWSTDPAPDEAARAEHPSAALVVVADRESAVVINSRPPRFDWPGFRGAARDSVVSGVQISTEWSTRPPAELWRRPVGPGWSSFAVDGDRIYTQEQRGDDEIVACYRLDSGEPVWRHRDPVRFWESNGGAGPRATPTLHGNRVFTFGATGLVNALDRATGAVVWTRNAGTDTSKEIPDWGFASSPLVVDDLVMVAVAGQLIAYDIGDGRPRWTGEPGGGGYSSPHLATIAGVPQVLLVRGGRTMSVAPADGSLLWEYKGEAAVAIVQPAMTAEGDVLIATGDAMGGTGIRRLSVTRDAGTWTVQERWLSTGLKPYFNDFVVHNGHAFGFDGGILSSIDLRDGSRRWKGGRYGHGQLMLLPEQNLLMVLSEAGELALVGATPDQFKELARFPAIEGKTWNHPTLVGNTLLVRNGQEMAAFRLPSP
jgi:outer membrane protein assembly factor BamB